MKSKPGTRDACKINAARSTMALFSQLVLSPALCTLPFTWEEPLIPFSFLYINPSPQLLLQGSALGLWATVLDGCKMLCFLSPKPPPDSMSVEIVELEVHMDCEGCEKRIRKAISKLEGVDGVDIDMEMQKVTVTGYVDPNDVLKAVRRTRRRAEFWPLPYVDGEYHPFAVEYHLEGSTTYSSAGTHNYGSQHGYNTDAQGYYPVDDPAYSHAVDDEATALFNDDNVHACAIM